MTTMAVTTDEAENTYESKREEAEGESTSYDGNGTNDDRNRHEGDVHAQDAAAADGEMPEGGTTLTGTPDKKHHLEGEADTTLTDDEPMPTLPLKKARTAYFIFADEKRDELKQLHKGEGVAALARATGELWSALDATQRKVYETQAAEEREKLSKDMQRLKDAGLWPDAASGVGNGESNDDGLILPVARVRKICKLDPDVKGMSKESTMLIAKATELFCAKLGHECVNMAQMQNRRKLLPEDVVEVCSMKERFMFLKDDLKDLAKEQLQERKEKEKEEATLGGKSNHDDNTASVSLLNYFSKTS